MADRHGASDPQRKSPQRKSLTDLGLTARGGRSAMVTGLASDCREVEEGFLFAALPGTRIHGAEYIAKALENGAAAILTDPRGARIAAEALAESPAALVIAEDPRQSLSLTAALWFGAQPPVVVAVTGTNGKTSVSTFLRQIWQGLGFNAINLGTTGVEGDFTTPLHHTTPDPITLQRILAEAARAGITHCAMEASSHGLAQHRLDGVELIAAGFTNLTQDHLDYHSDFQDYYQAKARLFTELLPPETHAVINIDNDYGPRLEADTESTDKMIEITSTGHGPDAMIRCAAQRFGPHGQELRLTCAEGSFQVSLPLIGGFQADNVLLAAGLAVASGSEMEQVVAVLEGLRGVRGRMQLAATRANGATVYVDYAHTPDAVATALQALRPHVMGRIMAIVGAGGDRDTTKRPLMGQAAAEHADLVFVTDDNPRSEDPAAIRQAVMLGCPGAVEIPDRAEAILRAVDALGPGDALLVCGKGHETGQVVGDTVYPFDDAEQASVAVAALDGRLA